MENDIEDVIRFVGDVLQGQENSLASDIQVQPRIKVTITIDRVVRHRICDKIHGWTIIRKYYSIYLASILY